MEKIFEGLVVGSLSGLCVIYAFYTRNNYPLWMLKLIEYPIIIAIMYIITLIITWNNPKVGVLILLILIAFTINIILFAKKNNKLKTSEDFTSNNKESDSSTSPSKNKNIEIDHNLCDKQSLEVLNSDDHEYQLIKDYENYGEPISNKDLNKNMVYPMFYGIKDFQSGPAPF